VCAKQCANEVHRLDPDTGEFINTLGVCSAGGEVYSMAEIGGSIFMTAYAGGDHIVYDPDKEWNQRDNVNPVTLKPAGPELIRPEARSVVGPDGGFYSGWMARYGTYGGGISRVDPETREVTIWRDIVPGQAVEGIAAGKDLLYFYTGPHANGLPDQPGRLHIAAIGTNGELTANIPLPEGTIPYGIWAGDNRTLVSARRAADGTRQDVMLIFDGTLSQLDEIPLPCRVSAMLSHPDSWIAAVGEKSLLRLSPDTGKALEQIPLPFTPHRMAVSQAGRIFISEGARVYELIPEEGE
jgi:streptogramin lyase